MHFNTKPKCSSIIHTWARRGQMHELQRGNYANDKQDRKQEIFKIYIHIIKNIS